MNVRYKINQVGDKLVQSYISEWENLRTSTDLGYLAKSFGFYAIPWLLSYYEAFGYRTFTTQFVAILALIQMPLMICAGVRLYWGMVYSFAKLRSNQKQLTDYNEGN